MRKSLIGMGALLAAAGLAWGIQEIPPGRDRGQEEEKPGVRKMAHGEIRVYLLDKDKKPVDLKDVTASLTIEDKTGLKRTLPLQLVTPKAGEASPAGPEGQLREVEGGQFWAKMFVMKPDAVEKKPGERRPGQKGDDLYGDDKKRAPKAQELTGPYFKAELTKEEWTAEFTADVVFRIKGETKTARGFSFPFPEAGNGDAAADHVRNDLKALEGQLRAGDYDKAKASVEHLIECVQQVTPERQPGDAAEVEKKKQDCMDACRELKAAMDTGKKDTIDSAFSKCRTACEALMGQKPREPERKGNGADNKKGD